MVQINSIFFKKKKLILVDGDINEYSISTVDCLIKICIYCTFLAEILLGGQIFA